MSIGLSAPALILLLAQTITLPGVSRSPESHPASRTDTFSFTFRATDMIPTDGASEEPTPIQLSAAGSGSKAVIGANFTQHMVFNLTASFTFVAYNPEPQCTLLQYSIENSYGTIHFWGTAVDTFQGTITTLYFDHTFNYDGPLGTGGTVHWSLPRDEIVALDYTLLFNPFSDHFQPTSIAFRAPDTVRVHILNSVFDIWLFAEDYLIPGTVTGLDVSPPIIDSLFDPGTGTDLILDWHLPEVTAVTEYLIEWGTEEGVYTDSRDTILIGPSDCRFVIPNLIEHQDYYVTIHPNNEHCDAGDNFDTAGPIAPTIPVVLVHGWRSGPEMWDDLASSNDPVGWLRSAGFSNIFVPAIEPCGFDGEIMFDVNAFRLASEIGVAAQNLEMQTGLPIRSVNIVAHSLGGLVTRRLLATPLDFSFGVTVRDFFMLGTPNSGVALANWGQLWCAGGSAAREMSYGEMLRFNNTFRTAPAGTAVYAAAGEGGMIACLPKPRPNGGCQAGSGATQECPNDGIVPVSSVYSCARWIVPLSNRRTGPWCHSVLGSVGTYHRDRSLFDNWIIPILRSQTPGAVVANSADTVAPVAPQYLWEKCQTLSTSETTADTILVDGTDVTICLLSSDSAFSFYLVSPTGLVYDSTSTDPLVDFESSGNVTSAFLESAEQGLWKLHYNTSGLSGTSVDVCGLAVVADGIRMIATLERQYIAPLDSALVTAAITADALPILGAQVSAVGVINAADSVSPVALNDGGQSPDSLADDGVYSGWFVPVDSGVYDLTIHATGSSPASNAFHRQALLAAFVSRGAATCVCSCHADPECNGIIVDVGDVVAAVDVIFRGGSEQPDPNPACPYSRADVNCDNVQDIGDIPLLVDVAFRGFTPESRFCDPCP